MFVAVACVFGVLACGDGDEDGGEAKDDVAFPASYADSYVEVRDCRQSGDHDLNNIRVLVDSAASTAYEGRSEPFRTGSVVLKEEYEFDDVDCTGEIKQWTVMQKLEAGSSEETLDWTWQRVDRDRQLVGENNSRCVSCHTACQGNPTGYDSTCADP
jgi:hypothetical protein